MRRGRGKLSGEGGDSARRGSGISCHRAESLPASAVTFHLAATVSPSGFGGYLEEGTRSSSRGVPGEIGIRRSGAPTVRGVIIRYVMCGPPVRFPCLSPLWSDCHLPVGARIVSSLGGWQRV